MAPVGTTYAIIYILYLNNKAVRVKFKFLAPKIILKSSSQLNVRVTANRKLKENYYDAVMERVNQ